MGKMCVCCDFNKRTEAVRGAGGFQFDRPQVSAKITPYGQTAVCPRWKYQA